MQTYHKFKKIVVVKRKFNSANALKYIGKSTGEQIHKKKKKKIDRTIGMLFSKFLLFSTRRLRFTEIVAEVDAKKSDIPISNFHSGSAENLFRMEQRNPFIDMRLRREGNAHARARICKIEAACKRKSIEIWNYEIAILHFLVPAMMNRSEDKNVPRYFRKLKFLFA